MTFEKYSRRKFLKENSLTAMGTVLGSGLVLPAMASPSSDVRIQSTENEKRLHIKPRYHRWDVDPGVEWLETNTHAAYLDWKIPLAQSALVLVDVWQQHYLKDTEARTEDIINRKLYPFVAKCREEGLQVIHAPARRVAVRSPNWVKLTPPVDYYFKADSWPPADFIERKGAFASFDKPFEPRGEERKAIAASMDFHPKVRPVGAEAVVCSGEELHQYCKKKGIVFLLYAGFNTNGCILSRTYGTVNMGLRGYGIVLVRDCTTGMETKESQPEMRQTNGAILLLETWGHFTVTSDEVAQGFIPSTSKT